MTHLRWGVLLCALSVSVFCVIHFALHFILRQHIPAAVWLGTGIIWPCGVYIGMSYRTHLQVLCLVTLVAMGCAAVFIGFAVVQYGNTFLTVDRCVLESHAMMDKRLSCNTFHLLGFLLIAASILLLVILGLQLLFTTRLWDQWSRRIVSSISESTMERRSTISTTDVRLWVYIPPNTDSALSSPILSCQPTVAVP